MIKFSSFLIQYCSNINAGFVDATTHSTTYNSNRKVEEKC